MFIDIKEFKSPLAAVKILRFKNRAQMEKSQAELPGGWNGRVIFADEEKREVQGLMPAVQEKGR